MAEYADRLIRKMFDSCRRGVAFNVMSTAANFMADNLYYRDPAELVDWGCHERHEARQARPSLSTPVLVDALPLSGRAVKIAVLGSSGGSAFGAFHDVLRAARPGEDTFVVAVDRDCGLQTTAAVRDVECVRIDGAKDDVSAAAAEAFAVDGPPDVVLLFYDRLVTPALYDRFPTFNVHPSLLPAFPGFHALERALDANVRFFGATLHRIDESVDGDRSSRRSSNPAAGSDAAGSPAPVVPGTRSGARSRWSTASPSRRCRLSAAPRSG